MQQVRLLLWVSPPSFLGPCPGFLVVPVPPGSLTFVFFCGCCSESEDSLNLLWIQHSNSLWFMSLLFFFCSLSSSQDSVHCTLSVTVCMCTPCQRARSTCKTDSFLWCHGPDTLACKARPSFDRCGTPLSVSLSLSLSLPSRWKAPPLVVGHALELAEQLDLDEPSLHPEPSRRTSAEPSPATSRTANEDRGWLAAIRLAPERCSIPCTASNHVLPGTPQVVRYHKTPDPPRWSNGGLERKWLEPKWLTQHVPPTSWIWMSECFCRVALVTVDRRKYWSFMMMFFALIIMLRDRKTILVSHLHFVSMVTAFHQLKTEKVKNRGRNFSWKEWFPLSSAVSQLKGNTEINCGACLPSVSKSDWHWWRLLFFILSHEPRTWSP